MKQIGAEIGVNESRVSQLHARAIRRLRDALGDMNPQKIAEMRRQLIAFAVKKPQMAKADIAGLMPVAAETFAHPQAVSQPHVLASPAVDQPFAAVAGAAAQPHAVVLPYKKAMRKVQAKAALRPAVRPARPRQAVVAAAR